MYALDNEYMNKQENYNEKGFKNRMRTFDCGRNGGFGRGVFRLR